jgi:cytochrome c
MTPAGTPQGRIPERAARRQSNDPPGRPKGEYRSAQREGNSTSTAPGPPRGDPVTSCTRIEFNKIMECEMTKVALVSFGLAAFAASSLAFAQSGDDLIKKYGCVACHSVDKKVVGPSYQEGAAKYKGNAQAPAMLAKKIKEGGSGVWGQVPMPPNPTVTDADMKTMVTFILGPKT